jgi:glycosyltransferase involved in cell wall biosynthesis
MTEERDIFRSKTLALVFTAGISLQTWHDVGMIDREVAIYNELGRYFKRIYFFTYGEDDEKFSHYLAENITIIPKRHIKNDLLYSLYLPFVHGQVFRQVDVLKTNQMFGSWSAALARLIYRPKFVARTGYTWSLFLGLEEAPAWKYRLSKYLETFIYRIADAAITSSQKSYDYVQENYRPRNHLLILNFVDTRIFQPLETRKEKNSICFVGRFNEQKNLLTLLEALAGIPCTIDLIGSGELESELRTCARNNGVKAKFLGNLPNRELPRILNEHEIFVLPSLWEGMPKVLLEAMACGLAVIGTDVDGIKEVIEHEENGILCDTNAGSIRKAIIRVLEDNGLKEKLGENARKTIEQKFSLEKLIEKELDLYERLLSQTAV